MSKYDIYISNGDHTVIDGNYQQTKTVAGKLVRSLLAKRGYWPGGHDEIVGNETWNHKQLKETDWPKVQTWFREAIQWMVDDELIVIKSLELAEYEGETVILVSVFDISERVNYQYPAPVPWSI